MRICSGLLLATLVFSPMATAANAESVTLIASVAKSTTGTHKNYQRMSTAEQSAFVAKRAAEISISLAVRDGQPIEIDARAVELIKAQIDVLTARIGTNRSGPGREDFQSVLTRASNRAPVVRQAFEAENMPAVLGLYVALIESEYNECLESSMGAKGIFQFLPKTGEKYGVSADELCDLQKASSAAARFFKDLRSEFGDDAMGSVLALQSYNIGQEATRKNFSERAFKGDAKSRALTFWATIAKPDETRNTRHFVVEGHRYVPLFFAAAIVGENPQAFGLSTQPLSQY